MISADKALEAGSNAFIVIVLAKLDCLVDPSIAVSQVGGHITTQVEAETFFRAIKSMSK